MTPSIIVDLDRVCENAEHFINTATSSFQTHRLRIFYAYKALPSRLVLNAIQGLPIGVEVMSWADFQYLRSCFPDLPLAVSGYVKDSSLIRSAIFDACYIVLENRLEIAELEQIARELSVSIRVLCRVKASAAARLGLTVEDVSACCKNDHIDVLGVHYHAGWNQKNDETVTEGVRAMNSAAQIVRQHRSGPIVYNFGGSFCERSYDSTQLQRRFDLFKTIIDPINSEVHFEPGRYIVGDAGVLSATVRYIDPLNRVICLDTCAYAHVLTGASPKFVVAGSGPDEEEGAWEIHGFWSAETDRIARAMVKGRPYPNAVLHIGNMGAYTYGIESQFSADQPFAIEFVAPSASPGVLCEEV